MFWAGWSSINLLACGMIDDPAPAISASSSGGSASAGGSANGAGSGVPPWRDEEPPLMTCIEKRSIVTCPNSGRQLAFNHDETLSGTIAGIVSQLPEAQMMAQGGAGGEGSGEQESFIFSLSSPNMSCGRTLDGDLLLYQAPGAEYEIFAAEELCDRGEGLVNGVSDLDGFAEVDLSEHTEGFTVKMTATDTPCLAVISSAAREAAIGLMSTFGEPDENPCEFIQGGGLRVVK